MSAFLNCFYTAMAFCDTKGSHYASFKNPMLASKLKEKHCALSFYVGVFIYTGKLQVQPEIFLDH